MCKNQVKEVILHTLKNNDSVSLTDNINELYVQVIERRVNRLDLSPKQKAAVIDRIIENLKLDNDINNPLVQHCAN